MEELRFLSRAPLVRDGTRPLKVGPPVGMAQGLGAQVPPPANIELGLQLVVLLGGHHILRSVLHLFQGNKHQRPQATQRVSPSFAPVMSSSLMSLLAAPRLPTFTLPSLCWALARSAPF